MLVFGALDQLGEDLVEVGSILAAGDDLAALGGDLLQHPRRRRAGVFGDDQHLARPRLANGEDARHTRQECAVEGTRRLDLDDFAESLTGRIRALSATHDLLSQSDWNNAPIAEVVRSELAPYMATSDRHVEVEGPEISLAPNDALSLGLALHELATNAAKYGALSTPEGHIHIAWRLLSPEIAELQWRESGGPPVKTPRKRGFGRDLLEKIVAHELQSKVDLRFDAEGVACTLQVPVRRLTNFALRSAKRG